MKVIKAIIEKSSDGSYAVYAPDAPVWGSGLTEKEAREDFLEVLEEQAEDYKEKTGQWPDWYNEEYKVDYHLKI